MSKRHINVENLSDAELLRRLQKFGVSCGPIIALRCYRKKLMRVIGDRRSKEAQVKYELSDRLVDEAQSFEDQTRRVYQKKLEMLMTKDLSSFQDTSDSAQAEYEDEDFDEEDDGNDGEYYDLQAKRAAEQHQESRASDIGHVHQGTPNSSPGLVRKTRFPVWLIVLLLAVVAFLIVAVISNMEPGYSQPSIGSDSRKNIA